MVIAAAYMEACHRIVPSRAHPTRRAWDGRPRSRCVQPQSEGSLCGLYPHAYVPLPRATMVYESYSLAAYLAADRSALPFLGALESSPRAGQLWSCESRRRLSRPRHRSPRSCRRSCRHHHHRRRDVPRLHCRDRCRLSPAVERSRLRHRDPPPKPASHEPFVTIPSPREARWRSPGRSEGSRA